MGDAMHEKWTALQGNLLFNIELSSFEYQNFSSSIAMHFKENPTDVFVVHLVNEKVESINIDFSSCVYVRGTLQLKLNHSSQGNARLALLGNIHFGHVGENDEQHFDGFIVIFDLGVNPVNPIDPVIIPEPSLDMPQKPIAANAEGDLFPYVYLRPWPLVSAKEKAINFITYEAPIFSPPANSFYDQLCALKSLNNRTAMQQLAISFIEGAPPFQGQFIGDVSQGGLYINILASLNYLDDRQTASKESYLIAVDAAFHVANHDELIRILLSDAFVRQVDQLWQNYFALIIVLGYDSRLLIDIILVLITVHVLSYLCINSPAEAIIDQAIIAQLRSATILLPANAFPLPPLVEIQSTLSPPELSKGWIEPYSMGDLHMVCQKLLRYERGEIAHIENIMAGEKKKIKRKKTHREMDYHQTSHNGEELIRNDASDANNNLLEETRRAIAEKTVTNNYDNYQTTYGPPTQATINGKWEVLTTQGAQPAQMDATRFARDILNKSVSRLTRTMQTFRSSSTFNEVQEQVNSTVDNTNNPLNRLCVYYWLNKIYRATVLNYGNRLMLEFVLTKPAQYYIAQQTLLNADNVAKPTSLAQRGIHSFAGINAQNYARLAAVYEVADITPPPSTRMLITSSLRSGEEKQIAIPVGYSVVDAAVTVAPPSVSAPLVLVGQEIFNGSAAVALKPVATKTFGEELQIAVAVMGTTLSVSPPSTNEVLVNVTLSCEPTKNATAQWSIKTYNALLQGYQKKLAQYREYSNESAASSTAIRSPLAIQKIEREEIKRGCLFVLFERLSKLTGYQVSQVNADNLGAFLASEAHYQQFFEESFEWEEMTYRFFGNLHGPATHLPIESKEQAPFSAFLTADIARVFLPVRVSAEMAVLYFLSCGNIWSDANYFAPINEDEIGLVNEIKKYHTQQTRPVTSSPKHVGDSWEFVVPTNMQIIGADCAAPLIV